MTATVTRKTNLAVYRKAIGFVPDAKRVIVRFFVPGERERVNRIIRKITALSKDEAENMLQSVMDNFLHRHHDLEGIFVAHCDELTKYADIPDGLSETVRLLIGAYFTSEYSIESAALFNPSIVADPDQGGMAPGYLRAIISFRATGEGHVSSIEFRRVTITETGDFIPEPVGPYLEASKILKNMFYEKNMFGMRLLEMSMPCDDDDSRDNRAVATDANEIVQTLLDELDDPFDYGQLQQAVATLREQHFEDPTIAEGVLGHIDWLAKSNYEVRFSPRTHLSERVIFPVSDSERKGIEDARFVRFTHKGRVTYYAPYCAYDGAYSQAQLLETKDFLTFKIRTLNSKFANAKGMALFPRKINGKYAAVTRVDGENLFVGYSGDICFWHEAHKIQEPALAWEFIQIGNCGSPIETKDGWLLVTHGVGPMRRYCIGVRLLDLDDPTKVIAQLREPLLAPQESEREGYVPNVIYSCGCIVHNEQLIIPYAMSDYASGIATVSLPDLLDCLAAPESRT